LTIVGVRVLVVETDERTARRIAWVLEGSGYAVETVDDPGDLADVVRRFVPDVLVMNTGLPSPDKGAWVDELRAIVPSLKLVDVHERLARPPHDPARSRADAELHKPFDAEDLLDALARIAS
jgi:DNA-binding response OmpR family regulator